MMRWVGLLCVLVAGRVDGATVSIEQLTAGFDGPVATGTASESVEVDLSGGQRPGLGTLVTLLPGNPVVWVGRFEYGEGEPLTMTFEATLTVEVAGVVGALASVTKAWDFRSEDPDAGGGGGGAVTGVVGYTVAPDFEAVSLVAPPGADLSEVRVTLTQVSTITGNAAHFLESLVVAADSTAVEAGSPAMQLVAVSVPEPGVALLLVGGALVLALRRRHG